MLGRRIAPTCSSKIVAGAALDARADATIVATLGAGADHPVALAFPEGEYLKGLLLRKARDAAARPRRDETSDAGRETAGCLTKNKAVGLATALSASAGSDRRSPGRVQQLG